MMMIQFGKIVVNADVVTTSHRLASTSVVILGNKRKEMQRAGISGESMIERRRSRIMPPSHRLLS